MSQYSISLALIAKNEEASIEACLKSFQPAVDEIIVVDTGSTDRTKEIARKYTDKIYDFEWIDDFAAARNFSFSKCTKTHILWCDADDVLYPEDLAKIKALDLSDKEIVICNYEYCHDEFGKSMYTVPRERIVRRDLGKWFEPIHEYMALNGQIYISDISTHHFKKAGNSERNLRILERIVSKPDCISRNFYYMGRECLDFGRVEDGIKYMKMFIEKNDGFWEDIYAAHYKLAENYFAKDEALFKFHLMESLKIEERRAEPYYLMAQYWENKQQWSRAIQWYEFCMSVKRPKELLASYQPGYYTWMPCLQLCVCYNAIGDVQKAYEWNERALSYRPEDQRMINNKNILENGIKSRKSSEVKVQVKKDGEGKKLNLGCGGKREAGYVNVDLFSGPSVDEVFDLDVIPYMDNTISAINSEHSLEHVGWQRADNALLEWYRVLKPGGQLMLKIPEVEDCFRKYIETPPENKAHRQWYKYTVYGVQKTQAGEPDEAQYHRAGWSQREICERLEEIGFIIDFTQKYNGWDTPSVATLAVKPTNPLKVGWIAPKNWEAAQTRIRVLNMNRWLRSKGYKSDVMENYQDIIDRNFDVCIIGKAFDEGHYQNAKNLKDQGKIIIGDLCEQLLNLCSLVVCCSTELAKRVHDILGVPVEVIEDAYEG
jgi:glycosyltransferase involved in cell wall biosynthesis/predicted SAM-dependent methyltransferase